MCKKFLAAALTGLMLCTVLVGCAPKARDNIIMGQLEMSALERQSFDAYWEKETLASKGALPEEFQIARFMSVTTMLLELNAKKVDFLRLPVSVGTYLAEIDSSLTMIPTASSSHYHMATRSADTSLLGDLDSAIEGLRADGTLAALVQSYITDASGTPEENTLVSSPGNATYLVGVTGDYPPMDYVSVDGTPAGFNVALLNAMSEKIGCNFEIVQIEAEARMTALSTQKIDIIFWNSCVVDDATGFEPTHEDVNLTVPYAQELNGIITKDFPVEEIMNGKTW